MTKIGLLSDTHGYLDEKMLKHLRGCDEIWHAGDIGSLEVLDTLEMLKPLKAVYGNIDDAKMRLRCKKVQEFQCEGVKVLMTHIGGYPNRYDKNILPIIKIKTPKLFISGHSHILKIMYDKKLELLHINPGAAGKSGFHNIRTMVLFDIEGEDIKNLRVVEMKR